jgi:hydroxymethylpyrimidine/phosphomethylpyrimidine kinase
MEILEGDFMNSPARGKIGQETEKRRLGRSVSLESGRRRRERTLVSLAGCDPSAGAGVLLDMKVFERFGFHGAGIITALTAQNTGTVKGVYPISAAVVKKEHSVLVSDVRPAGIKVGLLGSRENLPVIAAILAGHKTIPRVVDPVFRSSSGAWLFEKGAIRLFCASMRKRATVLTPNLEEAGRLAGGKIETVAEMKDAALAIFALTHVPCLVKGGHLAGDPVNLLFDGRRIFLFGKKKIPKDVHGTGCFFSASLLCRLAQGRPLEKSAELATEDTHAAIRTAGRIGLGRFIIL